MTSPPFPVRRRRLVRVALPESRLKGLLLVQAVHAKDPPRTVPADQYLLPMGPAATFLLRLGRYRLRLESSCCTPVRPDFGER